MHVGLFVLVPFTVEKNLYLLLAVRMLAVATSNVTAMSMHQTSSRSDQLSDLRSNAFCTQATAKNITILTSLDSQTLSSHVIGCVYSCGCVHYVGVNQYNTGIYFTPFFIVTAATRVERLPV